MKTKNLFFVLAVIAVLNLLPAGRLLAQTFTTLHSFAADAHESFLRGFARRIRMTG